VNAVSQAVCGIVRGYGEVAPVAFLSSASKLAAPTPRFSNTESLKWSQGKTRGSVVATAKSTATGANSRPRGRPRLTIDRDAVAEAVAELLLEGGYEGVGIPEVAEKLSISRATLYRTVPTKADLMGILFERSTRDLIKQARAAIAAKPDSADQLMGLIRLHAEAAVQMRRYMAVFFGGGELPPEVYARWHAWSRRYENTWVKVVEACMRDGYLDKGDPVVTTRLILGMLIWVSRWYRPVEKVTPQEIGDAAISLLHLGDPPSGRPKQTKRTQTRRATSKNSG
jgi:AcrR family transcriptional regulator